MKQFFEYIQRYPSIFALVFTIVGIQCAKYIYWPIVIIASAILFATVIAIRYKWKNIHRWQYALIPIALLITSLSTCRYNHATNIPENIPNDTEHICIRIDNLIDKDASMYIEGTIIAIPDSTNKHHSFTPTKVAATIQGINYKLFPGDVIKTTNNLQRINNMGNPNEFDYAEHMRRKGVYYTLFVKSEQYEIVGHDNTITTMASRARMWCIKRIMLSPLSTHSKHFLSAVLLGERHYIDSSTRTMYSQSGMAHILALSGLHIGIISLIIYYLLFPLDILYQKKWRIILSATLIIIYAITTGLSASVVRATTMSIFCFAAFLLRRKTEPINILALAGITLLFINPLWIYDVGFQLSFSAVACILLLANKINPISRKSRPQLYALVGVITVSIAAAAGSFILGAYYFHTIPLLFIIPNIIIVPLLPFILILGIIAVTFNIGIIGQAFDIALNGIECGLTMITSTPCTRIDYVNITPYYILIYYTILTLLIITLYTTRYRKALAIVTGIIASICIVVNITAVRPHYNGIVIMNDYNETPIIRYTDGMAEIMLPHTDKSSEFYYNFTSRHKQFLTSRRITTVDFADTTTYSHIDGAFGFSNQGIDFMVVDSKLTKCPTDSITKCQYLIITKNYYASINRILGKFSPDTIILSGNIYPKRRDKLIQQLNADNIPYYDISKQGAFMIQQRKK